MYVKGLHATIATYTVILFFMKVYRNPYPRSRPHFGQITKLLAHNTG